MARQRLILDLTPYDIGKIITVQTFNRNPKNPSEIAPESLDKSVGRLVAYCSTNEYIRIYFQGDFYHTVYHNQYLEIMKEL